MSELPPVPPPSFDAFAADYDAALNQGIRLSGESKSYFIQRRVNFLRDRLRRLGGIPPNCRILDFGCGTGSAFPFLRAAFATEDVTGVDLSTAELGIARRDFPWARTCLPAEVPAEFEADIVYSNGTFHHIPPGERGASVALIFRTLKRGGFFSLWENNPWNPGTRWVMSRIAFDRDARTLSPPQARRLLRAGGFEILRTDALFLFPRLLAPLRVLERPLSRIPAGAQYQVLCRRGG